MPKSKYVHITFGPGLTPEQDTAIVEAQAALGRAGVTFDTSASSEGERDWEFDWSLNGPVQIKTRAVPAEA